MRKERCATIARGVPPSSRPPDERPLLLEELRYIALGAAVLVGLALPFSPRLGILGLTLLFPLITRFIPRAGPGLNAATALFPLAVLAGLLYSRPPLPRLKHLMPFIAFYALTLIGYGLLITTADAKDQNLTIDAFEALKSRLWPTLLFFAGFALAPDRRIREQLVLCMVAGLIIHAASGIYDFATGGAGSLTPVSLTSGPGETYRAAGVLDANPNHLGAHLGAFSILALMGMLCRENRLWLRAFCAGAYAISGMVLILTQSRGSWLGFVVAHGVWLFYAHRRLLLPLAAAFVVIAVAAYSAALLPEAMSKRIEDTLTPGSSLYARQGVAGRFDSSVNLRVAVTLTAVSIFSESPIWGHGFRSFSTLALQHGAKHGLWGRTAPPSSESIILNTAVEAGLIGLVVYGWLFWALIAPGFELIRRRDEKSLGIALLAIFAAIFIESLTQLALFLPEVSQGFWLTGGMALRAAEDARRFGSG